MITEDSRTQSSGKVHSEWEGLISRAVQPITVKPKENPTNAVSRNFPLKMNMPITSL